MSWRTCFVMASNGNFYIDVIAVVVRLWSTVLIGCHSYADAQPKTISPPTVGPPPYRTFSPDQGHMIDGCAFDWDGSVYNLWPVGQRGSPRWQNMSSVTPSLDPGMYTFDPCYPFDEGGCKDSLACRKDNRADVSIGLAGTASLVYSVLDNRPTLHYEGEQEIGGKSNFTDVELICDYDRVEPSLEIIGPSTPGVYKMELRSPCCCADGCPLEGRGGLSFGSILCILFVCFVIVYLVGGMLYMKVVQGATGIEMIPHLAFWMDLPNLIVEGVNFVTTCGRGPPDSSEQRPGEGSKAEYEQI